MFLRTSGKTSSHVPAYRSATYIEGVEKKNTDFLSTRLQAHEVRNVLIHIIQCNFYRRFQLFILVAVQQRDYDIYVTTRQRNEPFRGKASFSTIQRNDKAVLLFRRLVGNGGKIRPFHGMLSKTWLLYNFWFGRKRPSHS